MTHTETPRRRNRKRGGGGGDRPTRMDFARACAGLEDDRLKDFLATQFNELNRAQFKDLVALLEGIEQGLEPAEDRWGARLIRYLEQGYSEERPGESGAALARRRREERKKSAVPSWYRDLVASFASRREREEACDKRKEGKKEKERENRARSARHNAATTAAREMSDLSNEEYIVS